ncbi:MAG: PcfJ domain-containing protein, partial [Oscillospiraceae bacterium]|nr:PcfJ domain-containing protein [Oscillospiraceae bacterium]
MEQINYEALVPTQPAEDVVGFALKSGKFRLGYLIYKAERAYDPLEDQFHPAVHVVCSECGMEFYADKLPAAQCGGIKRSAGFGWRNPLSDVTVNDEVIDGDKTVCPYCCAEAQTVHVGRVGDELTDSAYVSVFSRLGVEGRRDRLVLTDWMVRRCVNKWGRTRFKVFPHTAWVVEEKKIVRLMGFSTRFLSTSLLGHWAQRKTFCDAYGATDLMMPWDKGLLEGTTAENSKLDLYLEAGGRRPVSYLVLWRRRPAVENLLVQGCGPLVAEWIKAERNRYGDRGGVPKLKTVNWKEKRPAQMLGLNREELRWLRRMKWGADDLRLYKTVRDSGVAVRLPGDMELLLRRRLFDSDLTDLLADRYRADFWRILRYLEKQRQAWITLRDYWNMAQYLGWDMADSLVRWPRDLHATHDRAAKEQENRKDELLAARFGQRAQELEALSFEVDGLLIRPCRTQAELVAEGKALHHCVAGYAEDHAKGRTAIFFIRKAGAPDKPFFTLELDEKKLAVRQNRGLRNCARTPEVQAFEAAWLDWARQK